MTNAHQQLSIDSVLALLAEHSPFRSVELAAQVAELESIGKQKAYDAIGFALRCGLIERVAPPDGRGDRRQRYYALSEVGRFLLEHAGRSLLLRHARRPYTSCHPDGLLFDAVGYARAVLVGDRDSPGEDQSSESSL